GRVVRPGAERADAEIAAIADVLPILVLGGARNLPRLQPLPDRQVRFGIANVARHAVDEALERMRSADVEEAAAVAVGVDVRDGVLAQIVRVGLDPLGRSEQPLLFAVPGGVDDRPLRRPALLA